MDLPFCPLFLVPRINNHVLTLMLYGIVWLTHHDPIAISATSLFVNAATHLQFLNPVDNDAMAYSKLSKNLSAPKRTNASDSATYGSRAKRTFRSGALLVW